MSEIFANLTSPWGLQIIGAFLLLFFLVGLVIKRRVSANRPATAPKVMRYVVLPAAFIHVLASEIFKIPEGHLSLKITETIVSIALMSFTFHAVNYIFFSENNIFTKREFIPKLGRDVLHFVFASIVTACVLSEVWGLNLGNLLTALGVSSLVIGLALQEPLGNLFNGISILMARPFGKGDWLQVGDEQGRVVDFNWRALHLVNRSNELVVIPNNVVSKDILKNLSRPTNQHASQVHVGFSYDDEPELVKSALLELAASVEGVLKEPPPEAFTLSYDDFAISYGLKVYIKDYKDDLVAKDLLMTKVYTMAKEKGFSIPFPTQRVHIESKKSAVG